MLFRQKTIFQSSMAYMTILLLCCFSISVIVGATEEPCEDSYYDEEHCPEWAQKGHCRDNKSYMSRNCRKTCGFCGSATLYRDQPISTAHSAPEGTGSIDEAQFKDSILTQHNELRRKVAKGQIQPQPTASNMRKLVWNDQLAALAKKSAATCKHEPNTNRNGNAGFAVVGENLGVGSESRWDVAWPVNYTNITSFVKQAVKSWFAEQSDFQCNGTSKSNHGTPNRDPVVLHYAQLVWAETTAVGCGLAYCNAPLADGFGQGNPYAAYLVCNYGPGANVKSGPVYQRGKECSACPNSCDNGLCAETADTSVSVASCKDSSERRCRGFSPGSHSCDYNPDMCQKSCNVCGNFCYLSLPSGEGSISSQYFKDTALSLHNEFRRQVAKGQLPGQPPAVDMAKLTWNDKLAALAAAHAVTCKNEENKDRQNKAGFSTIGENRAVDTESGWDERWGTEQSRVGNFVRKAVKTWFDQNKYFQCSSEKQLGGSVQGYIQLVSAKTTEVGCGLAYCKAPLTDEFGKENQYVANLVCNYGPSGNVDDGAQVYEKGVACSKCSGKCDDGLCTRSPSAASIAAKEEAAKAAKAAKAATDKDGHVKPKQCQDVDPPEHCAQWARRGSCKTNPSFMHENCAKSCGVCGGGGLTPSTPTGPHCGVTNPETSTSDCQDQNEPSKCGEWTLRGLCALSTAWMQKHCSRTCKYCTRTPLKVATKKCEDSPKYAAKCADWATQKESQCIRNPPFMKENCAKSCNLCWNNPVPAR